MLDLTHARAGPTAVKQLSDWGANVIKVEPPGELNRAAGEESRLGKVTCFTCHQGNETPKASSGA